MKYQGITIFVLFFGVSLLDALVGGHWVRAGFWLATGAGFWAMDRWVVRQQDAESRERGR